MLNQVEELRRDIWLEMNPNLTMLEKIKVMNHIFFELYNFQCSDQIQDYSAILNISDLLQTRKGSSWIVGMLYLILCNKLQMPVKAVGFPDNLLLAYINSKGEDRISFLKENEDRNSYYKVLNDKADANAALSESRRELAVLSRQIEKMPTRSGANALIDSRVES